MCKGGVRRGLSLRGIIPDGIRCFCSTEFLCGPWPRVFHNATQNKWMQVAVETVSK